MKTIVCVSDLQVPYHDRKATSALSNFIKKFKPDEVVSVGDEMDMQTISKWSRGTDLEHEKSIAKDRDETCRILESLQIKHMIRSNHTDRLFNTIKLRAPGLAGLPELELKNFLKLDELGITYHEKPYELAPNWLLLHGDEGNVQPTAGATALGLAKRAGLSVVCGHTHRMGLTHYTQSYFGGNPRTIWGMEVGCMMDFKYAKYIRGGLFTWHKGFGVLYVSGQKVVPHLVPINNDGSFVFEGKVWK